MDVLLIIRRPKIFVKSFGQNPESKLTKKIGWIQVKKKSQQKNWILNQVFNSIHLNLKQLLLQNLSLNNHHKLMVLFYLGKIVTLLLATIQAPKWEENVEVNCY